MKIIDLLEDVNKEYWLNKINESDWKAGKYLYKIIKNNTIYDLCGKNTKVFILTIDTDLVSYCTLSDMDDVQPTNLTPWIGFLYTFFKYRKNKYAKMLVDRCMEISKNKGYEYVYISTNHIGLYEKYGFSFYEIQKDISGDDTRVYRIKL